MPKKLKLTVDPETGRRGFLQSGDERYGAKSPIDVRVYNQDGGSITVESRVGEGALFRVCLPQQENSQINATSE